MIQIFKEKNRNNFSPELLNKISMKELFKGNITNNFLAATDGRIESVPPFSRMTTIAPSIIHPQIYDPQNPGKGTIPGQGFPTQHFQGQISSGQAPPLPSPQPINENRINGENGSMNFLLKKNDGKPEKGHKLFSTSSVEKIQPITTVTPLGPPFQALPPEPNNGDQLAKKRKRYIKNNKLVFVQPGSAAAKKLEVEGSEKEEEINKMDNNEDMFEQNMEYNSMEEQLSKGKKPRGSRYRGVSRNGNQWQVLIMVNKKKRYVGSYSNEEEAARAYDKVALQNHGAKAKTNFDYLEEEVQKILADPPLLKLTV